jgi:hypothetical protein
MAGAVTNLWFQFINVVLSRRTGRSLEIQPRFVDQHCEPSINDEQVKEYRITSGFLDRQRS